MKSKNEYIGDDKFKKFLEHYNCPTHLTAVKLRFAGAVCSPNIKLRPADVIASLWENNNVPRLETKNEADLFFKFFMGLWDEMLQQVSHNTITLPRISPHDDLKQVCITRFLELEFGFIEGFWGGCENVEIPAYIAEVVDSLTQLAQTYRSLAEKIDPEKENKAIFDAIIECDKMATKSIGFIIENYALPRINSMQNTIN